MTNVNFDRELALGILRDFVVGLPRVKINWAEHCFWRLVNFLLTLSLAAKRPAAQSITHFTVKCVPICLSIYV